MTQRDETTMPQTPEKAHGDALEDALQATPDESAGDGDDSSAEGSQG